MAEDLNDLDDLGKPHFSSHFLFFVSNLKSYTLSLLLKIDIDFGEIESDLERFQEDETVQQALHKGKLLTLVGT